MTTTKQWTNHDHISFPAIRLCPARSQKRKRRHVQFHVTNCTINLHSRIHEACQNPMQQFSSHGAVARLLCYRLDRVQALPLSFVRFLRLANSSSKNRAESRKTVARWARTIRQEIRRNVSRHIRAFVRAIAGLWQHAMPPRCPSRQLARQLATWRATGRNVRVAVRATADATSRETSRKMTRRNSAITLSTMTPKIMNSSPHQHPILNRCVRRFRISHPTHVASRSTI